MSIVLVTGSGGLVGSEAVDFYIEQGYTVVGIDNDMRAQFFGTSVKPRLRQLQEQHGAAYQHFAWDIRSINSVEYLFRRYQADIKLIIHTAAQPSHDYAASQPFLDFGVNATSTLNLLETMRQYAPEAVFVFASTNKVYGDTPNRLDYDEGATRYEPHDPAFRMGFDENTSIDQCTHSLFGASKLAADVLTQEYGRYFGLKTGIFRGGCLTGANHAGAEQHGFLAYLVSCLMQHKPYTIYGYQGKQVRDNLHARDLLRAFDRFYQEPRAGEVYNIGGGSLNSVSVLEAIQMAESLSGCQLDYQISPTVRTGDHQWYISDTRKFQRDYPGWEAHASITQILREMIAKYEAR